MKKHILQKYSERIEKKAIPEVYYDFASQVSYYDSQFKEKVISRLTEKLEFNQKINASNMVVLDTTILTESRESSDPDNCHLFGDSTIETRQVETSDSDSLWSLITTMTTYTSEDTDRDEAVPSFQ